MTRRLLGDPVDEAADCAREDAADAQRDYALMRERESLILSAASPAAAAAATGLTRARASQVRTAAGIATPTGRPPSPTSRAALAALGTRVLELAALASVTPDELITAGWEALTTRDQRVALRGDHDTITRSRP